MAKTLDQQLEAETIIRWDETGGFAKLWTASTVTRKIWKSFGFPVAEDAYGWVCWVPVDRISYKPIRKVDPDLLPKTPHNPEILKKG